MGHESRRRLEELKELLWREHRTVVEMPDTVPEDLQIRLIEKDLARIQTEGEVDPYFDDCPICQAMKAEGMEWTRHLDFCTGWCPGCEILEWCTAANDLHTPEEIAWMKANNDFPPDSEETLPH
jgi:hypothetical protein